MAGPAAARAADTWPLSSTQSMPAEPLPHPSFHVNATRQHRCIRDRKCSCDCLRYRCPQDVHRRVCTRPEPFHYAPEDSRFAARAAELAASLSAAPSPCIWDDTEVLLKASVYSDERVLIINWVLAWLRGLRVARTCAPRLHVVSDVPEPESAFAGLFRSVPNLTCTPPSDSNRERSHQ